MWSAQVDRNRNLLEIAFSERVNPSDAEACLQRLQELLAEVRPGFTLLTDLSRLEEMDLRCARQIDQMMDAFNRTGIKRVVRVVPDPQKDIGLGIMSMFHYSQQVRVITCESLDEARAHLPP